MDTEIEYETPDGSWFHLREIYSQHTGEETFEYTTVSATIAGTAYFGKLDDHIDDIADDMGAALSCLELVPRECIYPRYSSTFTLAPEVNSLEHFVKEPHYAYDDCQRGKTFVADCVLNEIEILELLKKHPHPNIVAYYGCVVKDGLVTALSLKRYPRRLKDYRTRSLYPKIVKEISAALDHLHSLGLAHNDVNVENVCLDEDWNAVLIDFDSCMEFDKPLKKGVDLFGSEVAVSSKANDELAIELIEEFFEDAND